VVVVAGPVVATPIVAALVDSSPVVGVEPSPPHAVIAPTIKAINVR
jgi:hypothetical protein